MILCRELRVAVLSIFIGLVVLGGITLLKMGLFVPAPKIQVVRQYVKVDISSEEFDSVVKTQIKGSPSKAIWLEKYATEETRMEIEKLRKEKETLREALSAEIEKERTGKEIFRTGVERLQKERDQLSQQVLQSDQEKEDLKKLRAIFLVYQKKISELETIVAMFQREQKNIQSRREGESKPPSVVGPETEQTEQTVPVRLEYRGADYTVVTAYFKITSKKTGKFFVYEIREASYPNCPANRTINLVPGEYMVQVTTPGGMSGGLAGMSGPADPFRGNRGNRGNRYYRQFSSQTFTVAEEPIADFNGKKVHAVVSY